MGNKQSQPQGQPQGQPQVQAQVQPPRITTNASLVAAKPDADLPIFNLRNINPSGDTQFWKDIAKKYPKPVFDRRKGQYEDSPEIFELATQVLIKLRSYKNFMHFIKDLVEDRQPVLFVEEMNTASKRLQERANKTGRYLMPAKTEDGQIVQYEKFNSNSMHDDVNVHYVNSVTGEGLEPGKIYSYLSPYGNALVTMHSHATVIRKMPDGNYVYIDSDAYVKPNSTRRSGERTSETLSKALPPGKHIEETMCILQSERGVCMLYSILFMCYPDLSVVQLQEIIGETFLRTYNYLQNHPEVVKKNQYSDEYYEHERFFRPGNFNSDFSVEDRNDLYILAVMEDFLFTDQGPTRRLPPEQRLQVRKTAGRRRRKRSKKTRRR
jgi:hypothetical protein